MIIKHKISLIFVGCWLFSVFISTQANAYDFPPYKGITLKIIGDISGNYSNNVTFSSDEENKIESFRKMLNLGMDFRYTGKRRNLGVSGRMHRQLFEKNPNVRNKSENVMLFFNNEFTRYDRISIRNRFSHTQEPERITSSFDLDECLDYYKNYGISDGDIESLCDEFEDEFGRFRGRFDSYRNQFSLTYDKDISNALSLSTRYTYGRYWSTAEGTNDSDQNGFGLNGNYRPSAITSFSVTYTYQLSSFEEGGDRSRQSLNAGIRQYLTKWLFFSGRIGTDLVSDGNDSISARAAFNGEIDEKTTGSISYNRETRIATNRNDTFKNWKLTGTFTRYLLEDLIGSLSAFYGKGYYSSISVSDTLLGSSINLSYIFWQGKRGSNLRGNFGYLYSSLDSTDEDRKYKRYAINSGVTFTF